MNQFKLVIASFMLILFVKSSHGQDKKSEPLSELYLTGKWKAVCAMEVVNHATLQNCQLCPFVIDPNDKSRAEIKDIEMEFQSDSIVLNRNGTITKVPYTRDPDNHSIKFTFDNRNHLFRVFFYDDNRILEDSDGFIIVLEKKS